MIKTLTGHGLTLTLDSDQIIADDPGAGTPAMVTDRNGKAATFWCALDTGELECGEVALNMSQQNWLEDQCDEVDAFMDAHSN